MTLVSVGHECHHGHGNAGVLPLDHEITTISLGREADGQHLNHLVHHLGRCTEHAHIHGHHFVGDGNAPALEVGVHMEHPLRLAGHGIERIAAGVQSHAADHRRAGQMQGGGLVGSQPPRLAERNELAEHDPLARGRCAVTDPGRVASDHEVGHGQRAGALRGLFHGGIGEEAVSSHHHRCLFFHFHFHVVRGVRAILGPTAGSQCEGSRCDESHQIASHYKSPWNLNVRDREGQQAENKRQCSAGNGRPAAARIACKLAGKPLRR